MGKLRRIFRIAAVCKTDQFSPPYCMLKTPYFKLNFPLCIPKRTSKGGCDAQCKTKLASIETRPIRASYLQTTIQIQRTTKSELAVVVFRVGVQ